MQESVHRDECDFDDSDENDDEETGGDGGDGGDDGGDGGQKQKSSDPISISSPRKNSTSVDQVRKIPELTGPAGFKTGGYSKHRNTRRTESGFIFLQSGF